MIPWLLSCLSLRTLHGRQVSYRLRHAVVQLNILSSSLIIDSPQTNETLHAKHLRPTARTYTNENSANRSEPRQGMRSDDSRRCPKAVSKPTNMPCIGRKLLRPSRCSDGKDGIGSRGPNTMKARYGRGIVRSPREESVPAGMFFLRRGRREVEAPMITSA